MKKVSYIIIIIIIIILPFTSSLWLTVGSYNSARSPTLPTFQVAEGFAVPAATASFGLQFSALLLLTTDHFRLLAFRYGTVCHWKLRQYRLWRSSTLDSRRFCLL